MHSQRIVDSGSTAAPTWAVCFFPTAQRKCGLGAPRPPGPSDANRFHVVSSHQQGSIIPFQTYTHLLGVPPPFVSYVVLSPSLVWYPPALLFPSDVPTRVRFLPADMLFQPNCSMLVCQFLLWSPKVSDSPHIPSLPSPPSSPPPPLPLHAKSCRSPPINPPTMLSPPPSPPGSQPSRGWSATSPGTPTRPSPPSARTRQSSSSPPTPV